MSKQKTNGQELVDVEAGYIKPTKTFKFPKGLRPLLGTITDAHQRGHFKSIMVQAVLSGNRVLEKKKKEPNGLIEMAV